MKFIQLSIIKWLTVPTLIISFVAPAAPNEKTKVGPDLQLGQTHRDLTSKTVAFGKGQVTEDRARKMAKKEGLSFLDFHPCNLGKPDHCMVIVGADDKSDVYAYFLAPKKCKRQLASREADLKPYCFSGVETYLRSRIYDFLNVSPDGFTARVDHGFEVHGSEEVGAGVTTMTGQQVVMTYEPAWLPFFTLEGIRFRTGAWDVSDGWNYGSSLTLRDAANQVIEHHSESFSPIPSGGGSEVSIEARCDAHAALQEKQWNLYYERMDFFCKGGQMFILPQTAVLGGDIDLKPFGVGGGGEAAFEWGSADFCEEALNVSDADTAVWAAEMRLDCLDNPDKYFPEQSDDAEEDIFFQSHMGPIEDLKNRLLAKFLILTPATSDLCPTTRREHMSVEVSESETCEGDVTYACAEDAAGECKCDPVDVGQIYCVETEEMDN